MFSVHAALNESTVSWLCSQSGIVHSRPLEPRQKMITVRSRSRMCQW